jgi:hypothetical protein
MVAMEMQQGSINHGRRSVERLDPRTLTGEPLHIFNIYSNEYTINLGTCGLWYIPACPEGREYVRAPKAIPGTMEENYPHFTDGEEFRARARVADDIAVAILGTDRPEENIANFGVFVSHNAKPTPQEIAAAKKLLIPKLQKQIAQADQYFASVEPGERKSVYDDKFLRAARYLNIKKPWMSEAAEMSVCPFCSVAVSPNAAICSGCNQVINQTKFDAIKARVAGAK